MAQEELERYRIEPIPPTSLGDRVLDYLDQPLNTEDPIQNLASGVAEFIPGLSLALARRRGDKLGEYLSYLDFIPGGGIPAEAVTFVAKRKKLLNDLKREREVQRKSVDPNELEASSKAEARIIKQIKKIDAERPKANLGNFMPVDKTPPTPTKQGTLNFGSPKPKEPAPFNQSIYHGGPSGIETLRTPKFIQDDMYNLNKSFFFFF